MRLLKTFITAAIAAALLVAPAAALAKRGDRDHDRMTDKWEKRHHLNTHANDARKDPDKDGLSNLSEFRHHTDPQNADTDDDRVDDGTEVEDHTNPRRDDSDNDGVDDANEVSGTVVSFENGTLTIQLAAEGAGTVSGTVNDATRIECDDEDDAPAATASDHGGDDGVDNSGPGSDDGDRAGTGEQPEVTKQIEATVCWMTDAPLTARGRYIVRHTTREVQAIVDEVIDRIDVNALESDTDASELQLNDIGDIRLRLSAPLVVDDYRRNRETGSFILIDPATNATVAAGMIRF